MRYLRRHSFTCVPAVLLSQNIVLFVEKMAEVYLNVEELVQKAKQIFKNNFNGEEPNCCGIGPGRVNLIGEHTDYNNGFVFPMALPMVTVVVGKMTEKGTCNICTDRYI